MATVNEKMTAIANAIRYYVPITEKLSLDDMASNIKEVYRIGNTDGYLLGYEKGEVAGKTEGHALGLKEGTEAGRKAEYSDFWDAFQSNGNRTNYYRAFANHNIASTALGWNSVTFRPKYDLRMISAAQAFMYLNVGDLDAHLKECGIVFDSSECSNLQQIFQNAFITVFPTLYLKDDVNAGSAFAYCSKLTTIRKIIFEINTDASISSAFNGCSKLANIEEVEGTIVINISFSSSPLTVETMKRIILHLADYSGTDDEGVYSVTFSSACKTKLEAEGDTSPNGNLWTKYIENLGWILK